ncbi:ribosome biogenesis GTPase [Abditibacterium utsteinense]|uniref:Small ribosomal subunit biogenesis GTPase RsgA n=1 Tax=Abditibacterium utsteinense TaxID=1960156 RepID=A0A2S8SWW8_9BACT|nr:ribosome small subunit-dependent GTPase A [Abditibacterium utsteinense]PQV65296.1 ribosome biogenesis GTPase [Abditibacterium utsteinense]
MSQIPEKSPSKTLSKPDADLIEGVVMKSGGGVYEVDVSPLGEKADLFVCQLGGRLKKGKRHFSQPVSVGDRVRVRPLETSGANARGQTIREGFLEIVLPRQSQLGRSRFNKTAQITLANLDQVVIVMASREPDLNTHRLDRFLVLSEANELRTVIVFNKIDLLKKKEIKKEIEPLDKLYSSLGYTVVLTSAEAGIDMGRKALKKELKGHISAFIGSSGVGKSSLVMMIQPKLELWVGEVMEIGKGRHTTTDVTLHRLDGGGYIADTPGVKTIAMLEQHEIHVEACFPEFRSLLGECKFNDCTHRHEPGCAVRKAVEKEKIASSRYESYVRLWEEIDAMAPVYAKKKEGGRSQIFQGEI